MTTMKRDATNLAFLGGPAAFAAPLHVGRPNIGDASSLHARIAEAVDRRWLTNNGPLLQEFQRRLELYLGVRHCIPVCNGTVGLEVAIRALGISGDVILPSFTFIATAHAVRWLGLRPVFCDIDPATHNIDAARADALVTPATRAIIGVHVWGRPCDTTALQALASRRNLALLFDAAHAFGCSSGGTMIGGFGAAEVFSFHATKFFNTFEGGAIATNDDALAARIRLMVNFGFAGYDTVAILGTNAKMNEMSAAMGLTGLDAIDEFIAHNRENYDLYRRELDGLDGVVVAAYDDRERNNYQYIILTVDERIAGLTRDVLQKVLQAEGVLARRYFYPGCHEMEPYVTEEAEAHTMLPETIRLAQRVLSLPTGMAVSREDVRLICSIIRTAVANASEVMAAEAR